VGYRLPRALRAGLGGKRVAVVDDAISAGSAVLGTLADLRACGAHPVAIGALLVLGSLAPGMAATAGIPLESIATLPWGLWTPAECPLCASGVPFED
jgi:orotate phosphoribosyltransferase